MRLHALAVESRPGNFLVLQRFLEKMNIDAVHVQALEDLHTILGQIQPVAVAIIDVMGYSDAIWDCCKELKKRNIPMLIISAGESARIDQASYEHGAKGIFKKPVAMKDLANCIRVLITS